MDDLFHDVRRERWTVPLATTDDHHTRAIDVHIAHASNVPKHHALTLHQRPAIMAWTASSTRRRSSSGNDDSST